MSKAKAKHPEVVRFINVRALVTTLMLVVDYVIPDGKDESFIFDSWLNFIRSRWPIVLREQVMRWANQRRLIASGQAVRDVIRMPECVGRLPFAGLALPNPEPSQNERRCLERDLIDAVSGLPNYARSVLRGAWAILDGQGPEFDDARLQLVGMAFDLANGTKGTDARDLSKYAYHVLVMRLTPIPPKREQEPTQSLTQTQKDIADECGHICGHLIGKNRKYGDSALNPVHVFSKEPAHVQLKQQIDHKLARIQRGDASTEDEDTLLDLIGYLVLYRIALGRWNAGPGNKVKS